MTIRIVCINKDGGNHENPYTAISYLNWVQVGSGTPGRSTRLEMYDFVKNGGGAYVEDASGDRAYLMEAETMQGTKYVKTIPDENRRDNLLALPECK